MGRHKRHHQRGKQQGSPKCGEDGVSLCPKPTPTAKVGTCIQSFQHNLCLKYQHHQSDGKHMQCVLHCNQLFESPICLNRQYKIKYPYPVAQLSMQAQPDNLSTSLQRDIHTQEYVRLMPYVDKCGQGEDRGQTQVIFDVLKLEDPYIESRQQVALVKLTSFSVPE